MAQYKYIHHLTPSSSFAFDTRHAPGTVASNPGIYRCMSCHEEVTIPRGQTLPPHEHAPKEGRAEWQLIVFAQEK